MVTINPIVVIRLLVLTFNVNFDTPISPNNFESDLHDVIQNIILDAANSQWYSMSDDITLEFDDPFRSHSPEFVEDTHSPSEDELLEALEYEYQECIPDEGGVIDLDYKRKAVEYWNNGKKQKLSVETVKHKFRKVTSRNQLSRWETSLQKGGTRREKLLDISTYVYNKFVEKSDNGVIIHDIDLRKWALEANENINLNDFKASTHWIWNFKKIHRIVSRKINKFITRSYKSDLAELESLATAFVAKIKPKIEASGAENVYNADESGFNLELHSGRTLTLQGVKTVDATVQSITSTAHSYTILPAVSASGKLLKKLFVVLKEQGGTFGPKVKETMFQSSNVYVAASTSGKLTSTLFKEWLANVFLENTGPESILLLDSWTGHCPSSLLQTVPSTKRLEIFTIPKETTGILQPLDVYGFRIWKNFVRKFSDMVTDNEVDPEWTLLYYLRNKLRLCGTKLGCAEGGCGACTVMVSKYDRSTNKVIHLPVNACLAPICSVHGQAVTTVEGIGSTKTRLHPVQERIAKAHGSQCGFCTPGIVMSMYTLLRNSPKPNFDELEVAFQGNLCRCTGYRPILEGYKTFLENWEVLQNGNKIANGNGVANGNGCAMGKDCCKLKAPGDEEILFDKSEFVPYDPSQEPIFPPELKVSDAFDNEELFFKGRNIQWYRPNNLTSLLELKEKYPDAKIIVGNTEVGVEVKFKHFQYPVLIQPTKIKELTDIKVEDSGVKLGAAVTLQEMENIFQQQIDLNKSKTKILKSIVEMLHWFAGKQIRSVAAVGGNIMTGSPISDLNPIFMAANVVLEVMSKSGGLRKVVMNEKFFTGYRKNIIKPDEILVSINVPFNLPNQHFYAYKQARRRDDDIAIVNAAFNVFFKENTKIIKDIYIAFGGMAPTTVLATKARESLIGKEWNNEFVETGFNKLIDDLPLSPGAPGGMIQYRRSLTLSFFFRMYLQISQDLGLPVDSKDISAVKTFHTKQIKSSQYFQIIPSTQEKIDTVGRPIVHASAFKQASGEATYCDDIPRFENELYLAFVYSTKAYAEIISIDATEALKMEGVHYFFSAKDMEGLNNCIGPVKHDDEVFVSKTVTAHGQIVAAVVADDQIIAQAAARKVKVEYKELQPVLVSIDDAIKHKSFHNETPMVLNCGDIEKGFKECKHIIEGDCRTGGQEHFYFETQAVIAVPKKEDNEMDIYCSTQHPAELTATLAEVLNVPQNKLTCKVKRIGGGFGGKESKACSTAVPVCVIAHKIQRPVRVMLDRDEDMVYTGGRHPFYMKYKVGFNDDGKLIAAEFLCYSNAGCSSDLSLAVMERALFHIENAYKIPNLKVSGYVCKTNIHSNTAFRGFGGPQGMFCAETMIRDIAEYLDKDVVEVAKLNLYKEGETTHFNTKLDNCTIRRCWKECLENSDYYRRKKEIEMFNKENRYKKRGISVVPTIFGIAFSIPFLNQGGALVNIYTDGSVLITHGGIEMGQGLHTKMLQVASRVLGIPVSKIHISETATDKVPNTSPTAASTGSDINGMAVMRACQTLMDRLKPIISANPKGTWEEWIKSAYLARISLSSTGYYATEGIAYDWKTNSGNAFNYFTNGVGCTEVEVDCLTGDHQVLRSDIVMDLGESLNPAIDIGQVEGAFMQGYGLFVLEEVVYLANGAPFTRGPGAYKIPGFGDIPAEFNVALLKGAPNPRAVYSSKAVGEPPLFLASSALFAAREAIKSARKDAGCANINFKLDAPATSAKLRMACQDNITSKEAAEGTYAPWNIIP